MVLEWSTQKMEMRSLLLLLGCVWTWGAGRELLERRSYLVIPDGIRPLRLHIELWTARRSTQGTHYMSQLLNLPRGIQQAEGWGIGVSPVCPRWQQASKDADCVVDWQKLFFQ